MSLERLMRVAVVGLLAAAVLAPAAGAQSAPAVRDTGEYLYRFVIVQAAPGKLLDLIELYRSRMPVIAAGGDELPLRRAPFAGRPLGPLHHLPERELHRVLQPGTRGEAAAAGDASGVPNAEFARRFYSMVAWHEDLYAAGPPLEVFREHVRGMGLAHFEMLLALAGKRDELIEERQMENVFNRERGRGGTLDLRPRPGCGVGCRHARGVP